MRNAWYVMTSILIDTNVLVYSCDVREPAKREQALRILARLQAENIGCFSVQCIAEFFHAATRGEIPILTIPEAVEQANILLASFPTFPLTPMLLVNGMLAVREYRLSYYDAQIWACAQLNQIPVIFSEDFPDRQTLEGVRFVNPFAEGFKLEDWL